ncbi:MAG TPA: hypothetical protein VIU61_11460 [Kofleriaceae bacterium]
MRHVGLFVLVGGCRGLLGIDEAVPLPSDGPAPDAPADTLPDVPASAFRIRVVTQIDGKSHLVFRGSSLSWRHYTFAAPGRALAVAEPTTLDGVPWYPLWPDVPTVENRDCNCVSNATVLGAAVPQAPAIVTIDVIQARKAPLVVQSPDATNQFTAIVELTDEGIAGAAFQTVDITVTPR